MTEHTIGRRLKALRDSRGMSQVDMCAVLGLNDRQTISQIEAGQRKVSADELVKAIQHFGVTLAQVTNPFLLFDKESFSWRQNHVAVDDLDQYETRAGELVGAYRELNRLGDVRLPKIMPRLGLTHASSFEAAIAAGEDVAAELELGETPASRLSDSMEKRLSILVLMVDCIEGVSGAACRLPELNAVLINRHESEARRSFDLAHEFFHLLTWDCMKPQRVESSEATLERPKTRLGQRNERIERLADNFAAGILMPSAALSRLGSPKGDLAVWLDAAAAELGVSSIALKWRIANSQKSAEVSRVPDEELKRLARERGPSALPLPFSGPFVQTIANAIGAGHISARRASALLDMTIDDLGELCEAHGVERPIEL